VVKWSELLATNLAVSGPIPGVTSISDSSLEQCPLRLVRITEELLERK
jgi:hypothetical protein